MQGDTRLRSRTSFSVRSPIQVPFSNVGAVPAARYNSLKIQEGGACRLRRNKGMPLSWLEKKSTRKRVLLMQNATARRGGPTWSAAASCVFGASGFLPP